jgi:hypothetical protein
MNHPMRRLGIEFLEDRFLPSSTASISGLAMENLTNPAVSVHSVGLSNTLVSNNSPGSSEYTTPGTGPSTNTTTVTSKSAADEYNSTGTGITTQNGTQTLSQDDQDEYATKTSENSTSQLSQTSQNDYSEMDYPIQQKTTLAEGGVTANTVDNHAIASTIPNAIVLPPISTGPPASALQSAGTVLTAPPAPNPSNADATPPMSGGSQEIAFIDPGQPSIYPQDSTDYFTLPDFFAIRVDPAIVNQTIDQVLAGLDALIPDQIDQESLSVRLGYWVIAVSATAMSCELIRQDIRTRQKVHAEIRLLNAPIPEDHR